MFRYLAFCFLILAACGSVTATSDAGADGSDASLNGADAAVMSSQPPGQEITSGAGSVQGGGYTLDVQLGHPISRKPMEGGGFTVEGAASIKP